MSDEQKPKPFEDWAFILGAVAGIALSVFAAGWVMSSIWSYSYAN